jgi:hypothetical protein
MPASGAQPRISIVSFMFAAPPQRVSSNRASKRSASIDPNQRLWMLKLDDEPAPQNAGIASFLQL